MGNCDKDKEPTILVINNEQAAPQPWLRFWARNIDLSVFFLLSEFIISPYYSTANGFNLIAYSFMIIITIGLESVCLTFVGNTPGKWLANIQIADSRGHKLSIQQSFSRTLQVWVKGMWFGFPILSLVAMDMSKSQLVKNGSTSWDLFCGTKVSHGSVSSIRYVGIVAAIIITTLLNRYL